MLPHVPLPAGGISQSPVFPPCPTAGTVIVESAPPQGPCSRLLERALQGGAGAKLIHFSKRLPKSLEMGQILPDQLLGTSLELRPPLDVDRGRVGARPAARGTGFI